MERTTNSKLAARSTSILTPRSISVRQSGTAVMPSVRVLGKLCPCCGEAGAVLCETKKNYPMSVRVGTSTRQKNDRTIFYNDAH